MYKNVSKKGIVTNLFALMLVLTIAISTNMSVLASSNNSEVWIVNTDDSKSIYLENTATGEKMVEAWGYNEKGELVKLDLEKYVESLNNELRIDEKNLETEEVGILTDQKTDFSSLESYNTRASIPVLTYSYTQVSSHVATVYGLKCTADVTAPASSPATISFGNSLTISESYSANVSTSIEKSNIRSGASFGWTTTASSNANFGITYTVPAGKTGYVRFCPRYNYTIGNMRIKGWYNGQCISDTTKAVSAYSPIKLSNGFADGVYQLIIKN